MNSTFILSRQRRAEVLDTLRRGIVPASAVDVLAVDLERFEPTLREELAQVKLGCGMSKAVRGEYGTGNTFFARWLQELALRQGFAIAEVQVSEIDTPLHRLSRPSTGGWSSGSPRLTRTAERSARSSTGVSKRSMR